MKTCSCKAIVRSSGVYDFLIMLPFAIPGVVSWTMTQLQLVHESLVLSGTFPEFSVFHLFFINIMACVTIVWSVLRVMSPKPIYGLYDSAARIGIVVIMLVYLMGFAISEIIWFFLIIEVSWAVLQINAYFFKNKNSPNLRAKLA